jgi:hypothetical protein
MREFGQLSIERIFRLRHRNIGHQEIDDTAKREELSRAIERISSLNPIWDMAIEKDEPENYRFFARGKCSNGFIVLVMGDNPNYLLLMVNENGREGSKAVFDDLYYGECCNLLKAYMRPFVAERMAENQRKLNEKLEQMKPKIDKDRFWND